LLAAPGILPAQESAEEMSQKIQALEKLILELKAEMTAMKSASTQTQAATTESAAAASVSPSSTPKNSDGKILIASLAGPTSVPAKEMPEPQDAVLPGTSAPSSDKVSLSSLLGPTSLQGYVDTYYGWNFNNPSNLGNNLYSFNRFGNQFGLNLVQLQIDKAPSEESRTGYRVSLGFGQAMTGLSELDPGETSAIAPVGGLGSTGIGFAQYLMEGYFSYMPANGFQVDVGKFVTPVGVELVPSRDNWNYSRGLVYSWTNPYFHLGMRAKYTINDKVAVTGFLLNGWNNIFDRTSAKTYAGQISLTPSSKFAITQTYMGGPEVGNTVWRHLSDTIVTISPTSKLSFIGNVIYWIDKFGTSADPWVSATAGYVKYKLNDSHSLAARYEYLNDKFGYATGAVQPLVALGTGSPVGARVHEITATFERSLAKNIITRWEFRRDLSNVAYFEKGAGNFVDRQNTFNVGLMFTFDSREATK